MFEGLVARVVKKYLADYFEYGSLNVQGISDIHVRNASLKPGLVDAVQKLSIESLHVKVSPLQLLSTPQSSYAVDVKIDGVQVILATSDEKEWDEWKEFQALKAEKLAVIEALRNAAIEAIETKLTKLDGELKLDSSPTESTFMGMLKRIAVRVTENLQISLTRLKVSYLFQGDSQSGSIGLSLDAFHVTSSSLEPVIHVGKLRGHADDEPRKKKMNNNNSSSKYSQGEQKGTLEGLINAASDETSNIAGIGVEPIQGETSRIVRKQVQLTKVEIVLQENNPGDASRRSPVLKPFNVESVVAVNLSANPFPTVGIVEVFITQVELNLNASQIPALNLLSESLSKQAKWKQWCRSQFETTVQYGVSADEQFQCFAIYEKMVEQGKLQVDPRTKRPDPKGLGKIQTTSGLESILADLSWLEQREMAMHTETVKTLLTSAIGVVAQRERKRLAASKDSKSMLSSGRETISSWVGWALGSSSSSSSSSSSDKHSSSNAEITPELRATAKQLSSALGIESDDQDPTRRRRQYRKIFESIDKDGSGDIDAVELQLGLALSGTSLSAKAVLELISKFDADNSGSIDFDEFCSICDLAPSFFQEQTTVSVARDDKPTLAFSLLLEGARVVFSGTVENISRTLDCQFGCTRLAAAVLGIENFHVGHKSVQLSLESVDLSLLQDAAPSTPTARRKCTPFLSSSSEADRATQSSAGTTLWDLNVYLDQIQVYDVGLLDHNAREVDASIAQVDSFGQMVSSRNSVHLALQPQQSPSDCPTFLCSKSATGPQPLLQIPFTTLQGEIDNAEERFLRVQVQAKLQEESLLGKLWSSTMTRTLGSNDNTLSPVIAQTTIHLDEHLLKPTGKVSILSKIEQEFEQWFNLEGEVGRVLLRFERETRTNSDHGTPARHGHRQQVFGFQAVTRTGVAYANVASAAYIGKTFFALDNELLLDMDLLSRSVQEALPWKLQESQVDWRFKKALLCLEFAQVSNLPLDTSVVSCSVDCGSEHLAVDPFEPNLSITLGQFQNLFQLVDTEREAEPLRIRFVLSDGDVIVLKGLKLNRLLRLYQTEESIIWCRTEFEQDETPYPVRVLVRINLTEARQPDDVMQDTDSTAATTGVGQVDLTSTIRRDSLSKGHVDTASDGEQVEEEDEEEEEGVLPPPPPFTPRMRPEDWTASENADVFGLASFPPILERNLAYLRVRVVEARNLIAADIGGTSDPYCVLKCNDEEARTEIIYKNLNPVWTNTEAATFRFGPLKGSSIAPTSPEQIHLTVMDHDIGGDWTDDLLGIAHLPLHEMYQDVLSLKSIAQDTKSGGGGGAVAGTNSHPRYSFNKLALDPSKRVQKWVPLHLHDTTGDQDGTVCLEFWFEPWNEPPQVQSMLPLSLDFTLQAAVRLPTVRIFKSIEFNTANRDILIEMGAPTISLQFGDGASTYLMNSLGLGLDGSNKSKNDGSSSYSSSSAETVSLQAAAKQEQAEVNDEETSDQSDGESGYFSVGRRQLNRVASTMTTDFHSVGSEQGKNDSEWFDTADATPSGDVHRQESAREKKATPSGFNPNKVNRKVDLKAAFYMDYFSVQIHLLSSSSRSRRYGLIGIEVHGVDIQARYSMYHVGLPLFHVQFDMNRFGLRDLAQRHLVIGRFLKPNGFEMSKLPSSMKKRLHNASEPQVRLIVSYLLPQSTHLQEWDLSKVRTPVLSVGVRVEGFFLLATAAISCASRVFSYLNFDHCEEDPHNQQQQQQEPDLSSAAEADQGTAPVESFAALPISKCEVHVQVRHAEIHVMDRAVLGIVEGTPMRLPPKSLILRLGSSLSFQSFAQDSSRWESPNDAASGLPKVEKLKIKTYTEVGIAHTLLDRHMYLEIPEDFLSGNNVVLEPFSFMVSVSTRHIKRAKKLALTESMLRRRASSSSSSGVLEKRVLRKFDSHALLSGSEEDWVSDDDEQLEPEDPQAKERIVGVHEYGKHNRIWGVDQYTVQAQRVMETELETAKKNDVRLVRVTEVRVDGLEARFDTGDQVFIINVLDVLFKALEDLTKNMTQGNGMEDKSNKRGQLSNSVSSSSRQLYSGSVTSFSDPGSTKLNVILPQNDVGIVSFNGNSKILIGTRRALANRSTSVSTVSVPRRAYASVLPEHLIPEEKMDSQNRPNFRSNSSRGSLVSKVSHLLGDVASNKSQSTTATTNKSASKETPDSKQEQPTKKVEETASTYPAWVFPIVTNFFIPCPVLSQFRRTLPGEPERSWNVDRDSFSLDVMYKEGMEMLVQEHVFEQFNLFLNQIMFGLGINMEGFPKPFIRFVLAKLNVIACSHSAFAHDMQFRGFMSLTSSSFNQFSMAWEPILEPWSLMLSCEKSRAVPRPVFQAVAPKRLNLNVTDSFLKNAVELLNSLRPGFEPLDDERLHGSFAPNWVSNETGHCIEIWPVKSPDQQLKSKTPLVMSYRGKKQVFRVQRHQARKLHLHDTSKLRSKMNELLQQHREHRGRLALKTLQALRHMHRLSEGRQEAEILVNLDQRKMMFKENDSQKREHHNHNSHTANGVDDGKEEWTEMLRNDLTELFMLLDEDGSGEITCLELQNALSRAGEPISIEEVLYSIGEMDEGGVENVDPVETGISLEEFLDFFLSDPADDTSSAGMQVGSLAFTIKDLEGSSPLVNQILLAPSNTNGRFMLHQSHTTRPTISGKYEKATQPDQVKGSMQKRDKKDKEKKKEKKVSVVAGLKLTRQYSFPTYCADDWWIVANVEKLGRSSAGDVLFLETPVRIENRLVVDLEVVILCLNQQGQVVLEEIVFSLAPGVERSVPLKYLYAKHFFGDLGAYGFAVRPRYTVNERRKLLNTGKQSRDSSTLARHSLRRGPSSDNKESSVSDLDTSLEMESQEDIGRVQVDLVENWELSPMLVHFTGGQGIEVVQPFRKDDDFLDKDGNLLNDFLCKPVMPESPVKSGLIGSCRVSFEREESSPKLEQDLLINKFECVMLSQRNALKKYENKEVLTVQVLSAEGLRAADRNGKSDPFVTLKCGRKKYQTPTIQANLNPVWTNKATFRIGEDDEPLRSLDNVHFTVYDEDRFSSEDVLGHVLVSIRDILSWFHAEEPGGSVVDGVVVQKTFPLRSGAGVSDRKAQGVLKVAFIYERFAAVQDNPTLYAQHVFSFYPPFILENVLPRPIEVRLSGEDILEDRLYYLHPGAKVPLYGVDGALFDFLDPVRSAVSDVFGITRRGTIQVRLAASDTSNPVKHSAWSSCIEQPNVGVAVFEDEDIETRHGAVANLCAEVIRDPMQDGGGRRCLIYSPLWMVNKADLELDYLVFDKSEKPSSRRARSPNEWVVGHHPEEHQGIKCLYVETENGRIDLRARTLGNANGPVFFSNASNPLFSGEDDLAAGQPAFVTLTSEPGTSLSRGFSEFNSVTVLVSLDRIVGLHDRAEQNVEHSSTTQESRTAYFVVLRASTGVEDLDSFGSLRRPSMLEGPAATASAAILQDRKDADSVVWPRGAGLVPLQVEGARCEEGDAISVTLHFELVKLSLPPNTTASTTNQVDHLDGETLKVASGAASIHQAQATGTQLEVELGPYMLTCGVEFCGVQPNLGDPLFPPTSRRQRQLAIDIQTLPGEHALRTQMLTIQPRFFLANLCPVPLLVKAAGYPDATATVLQRFDVPSHESFVIDSVADPSRRVPFHFFVPTARKPKHCIQVRVAYPDAVWSHPFSLDDLSDFALQLRSKSGTRYSRVWVDANHAGASEFIVFRPLEAGATPYAIQNMTSDCGFSVMHVPSVKVGFLPSLKRALHLTPAHSEWAQEVRQLQAKLHIQPDSLEPGRELPLALDWPPVEDLRVHVLIIPVIESLQGNIDDPDSVEERELDYEHAIRLRFKPDLTKNFKDKNGVEFKVRVVMEGTRLIMRIMKVSDLPVLDSLAHRHHQHHDPESAKTSSQGGVASLRLSISPKLQKELEEQRAKAELFRTLQPKSPEFEVVVRLSSVGISLFSSKKQLEIAYIATQRIHIEYAMENVKEGGVALNRNTLDFCIGLFQIDSSQVNATFPVMLTSARKSSKQQRRSSRLIRLAEKLNTSASTLLENEPVLSSVSEEAKTRTKLLGDKLRRERSRNSFLRLQFVFDSDPTGASAFDVYRYLNLQMRPLDIRVDSVFLGGVLLVLDPLLQASTDTGSIEAEGAVLGLKPETRSVAFDWLVSNITAPVEIPPQDIEFFDLVRIEKMLLIVTVNLGSDEELRDLLKPYGMALYFSIVRRMARLEEWYLDLKKGYYSGLTSHKFVHRHQIRVRNDILSQLHEVLFNRTKRVARFLHLVSRRPDHTPIREPVVVTGGVLQTYGPGKRPKMLEDQQEKVAALIVEDAFVRYLYRKKGKGQGGAGGSVSQQAALRVSQESEHDGGSKGCGCFACGSSKETKKKGK